MFLIALTTSRITVVFHEFVGHGAMVEAVGADVVDHTFSLFGGATISYRYTPPLSQTAHLLIDFGGVGVQMVLAGIALIIARRTRRGSLANASLLGFAAANALYAGFYVSAGTFHGFGDFVRTYRWSGDARIWISLGTGAAIVVGTFFAARALAARLRMWVAGSGQRDQIIVMCVAIAAAAGGHAALTFGERAVAPDKTHKRVMRPMSVRMTERDLARYARAMAKRTGKVPNAKQLAAQKKKLRAKHAQFPFVWLLVIALGLAAVAGTWRSRAPEASGDALPPPRHLLHLTATCVASLMLVALFKWVV